MSITNHQDAIKHFICQMDLEMINDLLDDNKTYQEFSKAEFMQRLSAVFKDLTESGDTHLLPFEGKCTGCDKNKTGFTFMGNRSNKYISIIFESEDGNVTDLYECSRFRNQNLHLKLKEKLYIEKWEEE